MNDVHFIRWQLVNNSLAGCAIVRTLKTSIEIITLSPSSGAVGKEGPHSRKNVESRVKRNIKCKLLIHSKKPPTDGWRLNEKEFDELHSIYKFIVE